MSVPINLSIYLHIFIASGYKTSTGMYKIYFSLESVILYNSIKLGLRSASISDLESLPPEIDDMLLRLSKMAYNHLQNINFIF